MAAEQSKQPDQGVGIMQAQAIKLIQRLDECQLAFENMLREYIKQSGQKEKLQGQLKALEIDARYAVGMLIDKEGRKLYTNDAQRDKGTHDMLLDDQRYQLIKTEYIILCQTSAELNSGLEILKYKKSVLVAQAQLMAAFMSTYMVPNATKMPETWNISKNNEED